MGIFLIILEEVCISDVTIFFFILEEVCISDLRIFLIIQKKSVSHSFELFTNKYMLKTSQYQGI